MRPSRVAAAVVAGLIAILAVAVPAPSRGLAEPVPEPTGSAEPSTPPPPPAQVAVTAQDIPVGAGYWQGAAESYRLVVLVRNTGTPAVTAEAVVSLPAGVNEVGSGAEGCAVDGLRFGCAIAPGAGVTLTVDVTVAPGLWRGPPTGTVSVRATTEGQADRPVTDQASFGLDFPPGPPTPGIDLSVSDPFLPADRADPRAGSETATLEVRLANTGAVRADGTVDIVTPPGVEVATMPAQCVTRIRLSADRERCELGRVPAAQRLTLRFGLTVTREARAEAPLLGSAHASLTPAGQDTVTVQASYSVLITDRPIDQAGPTTDGDPAVTVAEPRRGTGIGGARGPGGDASHIGQPLSVLPMLISIVGVFAVLAGMAIVSLRRRSNVDPAAI